MSESNDANLAPDADSDARALALGLERVVLPAHPGRPPSDAAPVQIFLGTEPAQYRANRVFVWSIEQVRDPSREVRIHLMSELPGFRRRGWTTGFTNYRFAIPALMGGRGRAIYNDEDQIYLTDPGVLFDLDFAGAGQLSISDSESSVMLVDCERMASIWTLEQARLAWKRSLLRKASKATGLRGDLEPGWNARDEEFVPGRSHLLHYTTLHTQPWRPFPERFVYQKGYHTRIWHDLEREAIAAGFELFDRARPSRAFEALLERLRDLPRSEMGSGIGLAGELSEGAETLVRGTKARSLLEVAPDLRGDAEQRPGRFGLDVERRVGLLEFLGLDGDERFDGVICVDGLETIPTWDVPWLVEALFARAKCFVQVGVRCPERAPRRRFLLPPQGTTHTPDWWRSHFEAAASRHPEIRWSLVTTRGRSFDSERLRLSRGGPRIEAAPPRVWVLTDGEPGHERQIASLVGALGWRPEAHWVRPRGAARLLGGSTGDAPGPELPVEATLAETDRGVGGLTPPWPDLLIVAGAGPASIGRRVRERARGRTCVVGLGARAATPAAAVDLAVTPKSATTFPHPNRISIERPLIGPPLATRASEDGWGARIESLPSLRLGLLIGSGTQRLGLDRAGAEALGRLVAESAASLGASVIVAASRHAADEAVAGCLRGLGRAALVHRDTPQQLESERIWPALIRGVDVFVMAGLGETMLAEICETGRPVFLAPQRPVSRSLWARVREGVVGAVVARAEARPANDRGTTRPQEGLELLAARAIDRGWVRPRRDVEALRGRLVRGGHARLLRSPIRAGDLEGFVPIQGSDLAAVAARVRALLGVNGPATPTEEGPR